MLAFHTMHMKRPREDDSDSEDEPYLKKCRPWCAQSLPHGYTSPSNMARRPYPPPSPPRIVTNFEAMTPAQSVHSQDSSPASIQQVSSPHNNNNNNNMDDDMDTDEDDFDLRSQPPESPCMATNFLRPAKLNSDLFSRDSPINNTGRVPTPIYPNFQGGMNGLGYPGSGFAGGMSMSNAFPGAAPSIPTILQPPPRKQGSQQQADQDRSRRMPSPISEDEDIPDTPTTLTQSQLSRLSVTSYANAPDHMDAEMAPPLAVPPTPTRGRKRSGALTGMGRFSIGYRDDCEKCRQRVPGHYSHFLP